MASSLLASTCSLLAQDLQAQDSHICRRDFVFGQLTDERDLQTLDPRDAWQQAQKGKLVLVDVRPKARYEEAHPPGSKSAQLYRKVLTTAACLHARLMLVHAADAYALAADRLLAVQLPAVLQGRSPHGQRH